MDTTRILQGVQAVRTKSLAEIPYLGRHKLMSLPSFFALLPSSRKKLRAFFGFHAAIGLMLLSIGCTLATASTRIGYPLSHPRIPDTRLSCLEKTASELKQKASPGNCDFIGYRGEGGKELMTFSVEGILWEHWGRASSRGIEGMLSRSGDRARVTVFRRIGCGDGRTFFSRAVIFDLITERWFLIRLPICDEPAPG